MNCPNDLPSYSNSREQAAALRRSALELATHAEALLKATGSLTGESIALLRQQLTLSLSALRQQATELHGRAMATTRQTAVDTNRYVHQKPWRSIAIASLVGLALGYFSRAVRSPG